MLCHCLLTRFLVTDVDVEREDNEQRNEGRPPVNDKHHHAAQDRPGKGYPHVVVFEAGAPPCSGGVRVDQMLTGQTEGFLLIFLIELMFSSVKKQQQRTFCTINIIHQFVY